MQNETPRCYRFDVTDETITALRRLRQPWSGWSLEGESLTIGLASGEVVVIVADRREIEPGLPVPRLQAEIAGLDVAPVASGFNAGGNDLVLFSTDIWTDDLGHTFEGPPGSSPESAVISCTVTDSILIESGDGELLLLRCGTRPMEMLREIESIRAFANDRAYSLTRHGS